MGYRAAMGRWLKTKPWEGVWKPGWAAGGMLCVRPESGTLW